MDKLLIVLERISPVLVHYQPPVQWLFVGSLAATLTSILAFAIGYPGAARKRDGMTADGSLPAMIHAARNPRDGVAAARYVIESATMLVRLTSRVRADGRRQSAEADTRITYTVFALENILADEFDEFAHTNVQGGVIAWIPGSDRETLSERGPAGKSWTIGAAIPKGERRTFTTAFRYVYNADFDERRQVHDFDLEPSADAFCYPNAKDVIGELTIRVEADAPLRDPLEGDALLNDTADKRLSRSTPALLRGRSEGVSQDVVVGRWKNVLPRQTAELMVRRNAAEIE